MQTILLPHPLSLPFVPPAPPLLLLLRRRQLLPLRPAVLPAHPFFPKDGQEKAGGRSFSFHARVYYCAAREALLLEDNREREDGIHTLFVYIYTNTDTHRHTHRHPQHTTSCRPTPSPLRHPGPHAPVTVNSVTFPPHHVPSTSISAARPCDLDREFGHGTVSSTGGVSWMHLPAPVHST